MVEQQQAAAEEPGPAAVPGRVHYPGDPQYWIETPQAWTGKHALIRDEVVQKCDAIGMLGTQRNFAVAMALLEDWHLPGLSGNPDKWDFTEIPLALIAWVSTAVLFPFQANFPSNREALLPLLMQLTGSSVNGSPTALSPTS